MDNITIQFSYLMTDERSNLTPSFELVNLALSSFSFWPPWLHDDLAKYVRQIRPSYIAEEDLWEGVLNVPGGMILRV